jgi:hypothetical protein
VDDDLGKRPDVLRAIEESQKRELPCILCKLPTRHRGVFLPDNPEASGVGAPAAGKKRVVVYPLCDAHERTKELLTEVERRVRLGFN